MPTSVLSAEHCHLGEGPTYDVTTDTAWWFDIREGRLFEAHLGSGTIRIHALGRMASALGRIDAERQLIVAEDGLLHPHARRRRDDAVLSARGGQSRDALQ